MTLPVRYKVVRSLPVGIGVKYVSCFMMEFMPESYHRQKNPAVEYPFQMWAEAPIGGLLVFNNLENTRDFTEGFHIFRCHVQEQVKLPPYRSARADNGYDLIQHIWKEKSWGYESGLVKWPVGTEAWRKVKLIEEVTQ